MIILELDREMNNRMKKLNAFWAGFMSILTIVPTVTPKVSTPSEIMTKSWLRVGSVIRISMDSYGKKEKK